MFDFDMLERQEQRGVRTLNPLQLKAMAMKFRHNTAGYTFARHNEHAERIKRATTIGGPRARGASKDTHGSAGSLLSVQEEAKLHTATSAPAIAATTPTAADAKAAADDSGVGEIHVGPNNCVGLKAIFIHPFCVPLFCVPLGFISGIYGWGDSWTFWLNFLALIPLAKILGDATEELAAALQNDTLSGLLNATFGNAVEMIVSVQSIRAGLFSVVKASLLGSVLSNILLVLGCSFFLGGWTLSRTKQGPFHSFKGMNYKKRYIGLEKEQKFPLKAALISMGMLLFACMVVVLPTLFDALPTDDSKEVLAVSRIGSWITMSAYIMYLGFQLLTHKVTLATEEKMGQEPSPSTGRTRQLEEQLLAPAPKGIYGSGGTEGSAEDIAANEGEEDDEDEEDEASPSLDSWVALALMAGCTLVVAVNSEFLVDSINNVVKGSGIPIDFIGVILLPLAGNACEHASALRFSMRDRPGLAIGIAVGSSTQVALLVIPFSVLIAQAFGQPLDLNFGPLNVAVLTFSVLVVLALLLDGRSNWFKGYILVAMYIFIAALYLYIPPSFGEDGKNLLGTHDE